MKFRNTPRNGILIVFLLAIIALILLSIINFIPHTDYNSLNQMEKFQYDLNIYEGNSSKLKIINCIIVFTFIIATVIVQFTMCRCHYCNHLVENLDLFSNFCPYCGNSLNLTKKDITNKK